MRGTRKRVRVRTCGSLPERRVCLERGDPGVLTTRFSSFPDSRNSTLPAMRLTMHAVCCLTELMMMVGDKVEIPEIGASGAALRTGPIAPESRPTSAGGGYISTYHLSTTFLSHSTCTV